MCLFICVFYTVCAAIKISTTILHLNKPWNYKNELFTSSSASANHLHPHFDRLRLACLSTTFGAGEASVCNALAFDAVVAENVLAAHCVGHGGPIAAQSALLPRAWPFRCPLPVGTIFPQNNWQHGCLQFPCIDQRQQEDEELGEAVPQQLAVHVLVGYVPDHIGLAENRPSSHNPFSQHRMATSSQEHKEVDETRELCDTRE